MTTIKPKLMDEWNMLPWKKIERSVFKLQQRIYRASQRGDGKTVHKLQRLLLNARAAKFLAVRKVTQDNQGKKTAGIDGVKSLSPSQRFTLFRQLKLGHKAQPVRRVWIPKPGQPNEQRALGIPVMKERALQRLVQSVLEPEWEARFEPNCYGFRPGRSCHDAIEAIFTAIRNKPKYVLDTDVEQCFDRIEHQELLRKVNTGSVLRRQLKAWLKAGVIDQGQWFPTESGTIQGSPLSPLLANIAMHGIEEAIAQRYRKDCRRRFYPPIIVRYADDVRHITRCQIPFTERRGSEEQTFGSTAYPLAKAKRNNSMLLTQEGSEDVYDLVLQDPRNRVKTALFEAQSPGMKAYILRPQRLKAESSR